MHGVQRVGLVVVPALLVAHVDGDGRVEGGEDVVVGCRNRKAEKKTELDEGGREGEETSKHTHTQKKAARGISKQTGYNKETWISERAEHFRVKYWHYHTRGVE